MKKLLFVCSFVLSSFCVQNASAQLADGFYHFKNATTGRYISINDTDPQNYQLNTYSGDLNMRVSFMSENSIMVSTTSADKAPAFMNCHQEDLVSALFHREVTPISFLVPIRG